MGRLGYFSPFLIGAALMIITLTSTRTAIPAPEWAYWPIVIAGGLLAGVLAQIGMAGAQGAFAQVLPAPRGRSIRGRPASAAGVLLLIAVAAIAAAGVMHGGSNKIDWTLILAYSLGGAFLLAAAVIYVWSLPAAVADFAGED